MPKLRAVITAAAQVAWIVIAVNVLVVSGLAIWWFAYETERREIENRITDLATSGEEGRLASAIFLAETELLAERIPVEAYIRVVSSAYSSLDEKLRETARGSIAMISIARPPLGRDVARALGRLPGHVSVRVRQEADRGKGTQLADNIRKEASLMGQRAILTDIKLMSSGPDRPEVRCFVKTDCAATADRLVEYLKGQGIEAEKKDMSSEYEKLVFFTNHYEIWLPASPVRTQPPRPNRAAVRSN